MKAITPKFILIASLMSFCPMLAESSKTTMTTLTNPQPVLGVVPLGENEHRLGGTCDLRKAEISISLETGEQLEATCTNGFWEAPLPESISDIIDIYIDERKMTLVSPVVKGMNLLVTEEKTKKNSLTLTVPALQNLSSKKNKFILVSWDRAIILKHNLVDGRGKTFAKIDTSQLNAGQYVLLLKSDTEGIIRYSEPLVIDVVGNEHPADTVSDRVVEYYNKECRGMEKSAAIKKLILYLNTEDSIVTIEQHKDYVSWTTRDGLLWVFHLDPHKD